MPQTKLKTGRSMLIDNPLISIVVITYNSAPYVLETLESINKQTYDNIELIISDDHSGDDTVKICSRWLNQNKKRFKRCELITTPYNTGTAPNLNRGIKASNGEWIKILAGDDALELDLLDKYLQYIQENPEVEVLHSKVTAYKEVFTEDNIIPSEDASTYKINMQGITAKEQFKILLRASLIGTPTIMFKAEVFNRVGLFDERFPLWEDRPMYLKLTHNNIKLYFLNFFGAKYRVRNNSVAHLRTSKSFISNLGMYKILAYKELCFPHLPPYEKAIKSSVFKINLFFDSLENPSFLLKKIHKVLVTPLAYAVNIIDNKYR